MGDIRFIIRQKVELQSVNAPLCYNQPLVLGDDGAHCWTVTVLRAGKAASLDGCTIAVTFCRQDGAAHPLEATVNGNVVRAVFTGACYAVEGNFSAAVTATGTDGRTVTLAAMHGTVARVEPFGAQNGSYTNQLACATGADGGVYNGVGYKDNMRMSTATQAEIAANGWDLTGFIPAGSGDVVRLRNIEFMDMDGDPARSRACVYFFSATRGWVGYGPTFSPDALPSDAWAPVCDGHGNLVQFTIPEDAGGYALAMIRIVAHDIRADSVITVNEEIPVE